MLYQPSHNATFDSIMDVRNDANASTTAPLIPTNDYTNYDRRLQHHRTIFPTTVPFSQPQYMSNHNLSQLSNIDPSSTDEPNSTNNASSSNNKTLQTNDDRNKLVKVHHDNEINYVLKEYCQPIDDTWKYTKEECHFSRYCIVIRSKVLEKASVIETLSPTAFGRVPYNSKKTNYTIMDTQLVKCFNPLCKGTQSKVPKVFHHLCYMHMMGMTANEHMNHLKVENGNDKLVDLVQDSIDMNLIIRQTTHDTSQLIFPICGKRCYNTVCNFRKKDEKKDGSEYALTQSWDADGNSSKKSSTEVLIHWLTTEENCSSYFGGVDTNGRTNGNRKETYHHHIRDLIKSENGERTYHQLLLSNCYLYFLTIFFNYILTTGSDRSSEAIKNKINRIMASYKDGCDMVNQSGGGLEGLDESSFQQYIVNNVCKYFYELDDLMKDRPNVKPWFTNEHKLIEVEDSDDDDDSDDSIESLVMGDNNLINHEKRDGGISFNLTDSDQTDSEGNRITNNHSSSSFSNRNVSFRSSIASKKTRVYK